MRINLKKCIALSNNIHKLVRKLWLLLRSTVGGIQTKVLLYHYHANLLTHHFLCVANAAKTRNKWTISFLLNTLSSYLN
jgi:hypothetical protein